MKKHNYLSIRKSPKTFLIPSNYLFVKIISKNYRFLQFLYNLPFIRFISSMFFGLFTFGEEIKVLRMKDNAKAVEIRTNLTNNENYKKNFVFLELKRIDSDK